jgi:hypothetical protein
MGYFKIKTLENKNKSDYERRKGVYVSDHTLLRVLWIESYRDGGKVKKREKYLMTFKMSGNYSLPKFAEFWETGDTRHKFNERFEKFGITDSQKDDLRRKLESKITELVATTDQRLKALNEYNRGLKERIRVNEAAMRKLAREQV